jgi:hypothetical protein
MQGKMECRLPRTRDGIIGASATLQQPLTIEDFPELCRPAMLPGINIVVPWDWDDTAARFYLIALFSLRLMRLHMELPSFESMNCHCL